MTATDTAPRTRRTATPSRSPVRRWLRRPEAPALVFLAVLLIGFSVTADGFASLRNVELILVQVSVVAIIALAVNEVVLAGEIDISMGSLLGLCAMAVGTVAVATGGFLLPLLTGMGIGALVGAVNGALVTKGRVPAIIVTLGMLYALRGVILLVTGGASVSGIPLESRVLGRGDVAGIGYPILLLAVLYAVMHYVSRNSTWGRDVFAVGGNRKAARLAGLSIDRTRFLAFVLVGLFTGIAATVYVGRTGGVQPSAGIGLELEVIAAVVLGGTSIMGGRGSTLSPLVGAVLVGVILNGMVLLRVPGVWQSAVLGTLILLAVTTDGLRRRFSPGMT